MQLKKITLCGFKSFADKTEFDFGDGVTIVVGPNGCGKSNIVDAVKWVLGEQSAKSLRGGQMLDVIFNGTNSRKSMSYAEVTLTFSNTTGLLNTEADEVAVTRKLFRSGESQYLLNKQVCRLKDIREMFMDTGIGADAYSIIEQGKVETLLQSSKEDRRAVFEEAAGISRYKARKKEALRKLDRTEQNVLRLTDIIGEMEKRLRSIRYQAGKARNYQTHVTRLKELRLNQFLSEYYQLQNDSRENKSRFAALQDELLALSTAFEKTQTRLSVVDDEMAGFDREIRESENQLLQCTSQISSQQDRIEMGHKRCDELKQLIDRNRKQMGILREQCRHLQQEKEADQQQIEQITAALTEHQERLGELQEMHQQKQLELSEYRAQLEDEKSGLIDIARRTAQLHNEISSLDLRKNNLSGQRDRLHERGGIIRQEMEELLTCRAQREQKQQEIRKLLEDSQAQLESKREQSAQLHEEQTACGENLSAAKEYRSGLVSRQQLLADMEANFEGVNDGVRQIIQAKSDESQDFYYIKGMVAEIIQADVKYAAIIEAALAGKAQHLIATSRQAVLEDSENLENLKGRVQITCLDSLPAFHNGYDFSQHREVQAKLIDLVNYPADCERLALHLLGKTVLVDTIDSAVRLAQVAPVGYRWVSLDGSMLEADGTVHLGPQTATAGLISRKSELRQLDESLAEADERIRELQNQGEQFANQAQHLEKNLQELRTAIYETRTEEIETRSQLEQLDQNIERLKREEPLITTEIESLEGQITEALNLQSTSRQNLDDLESIDQRRQQEIDRLEEAVIELDEQDQVVLDQTTEVKVALGQAQQQRLALTERITKIQSQLQQLQHNSQTTETDLKNAQENFDVSQRSILTAESRIGELFMSRQEHQEKSRALRENYETRQAEKEHHRHQP